MPTYEEEVLADSPLAFWRLKDGAGATVMVDISGNNNHGTYYGDAVFGFPPPVESDPSAAAVSNRVGEGGSTPKPTGNLAMEGWIYCPGGSQPPMHLITGVGQAGASGGIFINFDSGTISARFSTDGTGATTVDLSYAPPALDRFYHVGFSRNGTQLLLAVNGEEADTGVTSSDPITSTYTTEPWRVGVAGTGNLWNGFGTAEPAVYDHAVLLARFRAHYVAALNSLSLFGVSNVISSAVLYSDVEPEPISFASLRHNWSDPLIERISFATGISRAVKGYEQADAQRIKPRREIEISQLLRDDLERSAFRAKLNTQQHRKWFIPILEDRDRLTGSLSAGPVVIVVDTRYKDYEVGGYLGVRELNNAGQVVKSEEALIDGLTDNDITATIANSYTNPEIYPARRGIVQASVSLRGHTDSVEDTTILARLIAEDEKVIPHRVSPWTPTTTYLDHEVFPVAQWPNNWNELREYLVERDVRDVDHDAGSFTVESDAIAASETFSWRVLLEGKDKHAALLGWFYAHAGSLAYLWVPSMQRDFQIVSVAGSDLTVTGHNYFDNYVGSEFRRDLAFVYNDNSMVLARIGGVSLSGANEVLTLSAVPTLTNLRSVSYLRFCRLDNDTLEIARETDTKARFAWLFREVLGSPE